MDAEDIMLDISAKYDLGWDMTAMFSIMNEFVRILDLTDSWRDFCETTAENERFENDRRTIEDESEGE